jgi:hypothetical protein
MQNRELNPATPQIEARQRAWITLDSQNVLEFKSERAITPKNEITCD